MEVKGKIVCKKSDNKAVKLSDNNWYNLNDVVIPYLEKANKGDEVVLTFEKKGVSRYVSKLVVGGTVTETETASSTGFACEVCGKELKDDKYKVCYTCNKKGAKPKSTYKSSSDGNRTSYGSAEDIAGKEVGCALNAASTVAGGCAFNDPTTAAQFVRQLAGDLLDWIRSNK